MSGEKGRVLGRYTWLVFPLTWRVRYLTRARAGAREEEEGATEKQEKIGKEEAGGRPSHFPENGGGLKPNRIWMDFTVLTCCK